jgi:hypothetical protein
MHSWQIIVSQFTMAPRHQGREIIAIVPLEIGEFSLFLVKISKNCMPANEL